MKTLLPYHKVAVFATVLILSFVSSQKNFAQDSLLSQDFKKGVTASSISATTGYQLATLNWSGASYPSTGAMKAGYLVIYSSSTPSLISSPNGSAPANTVFNGVVVPTTGATLPAQPATFATADGLKNGTTYNFMIVAYIWDGINISSYNYSSASTICVTIPPDKPDDLSLPSSGALSTSISGSFAQPLFVPDGYVVTYSTNVAAPSLSDGNLYEAGQAVSGDTIVQVSDATSFNTINSGHQLSPTTNYYIHVYSYVLSGCTNKPVYSTGYLSYNITTSPEKIQDTTSNPETFLEVIDIEPNPVQSNAWLKIATLKSDNNVAVTIFTADGRIFAQKAIQVQSGVNRFNLHTENLSRGMYVLRAIFSNGKTKAIPFIKK